MEELAIDTIVIYVYRKLECVDADRALPGAMQAFTFVEEASCFFRK